MFLKRELQLRTTLNTQFGIKDKEKDNAEGPEARSQPAAVSERAV